jgi:hypothetical protein
VDFVNYDPDIQMYREPAREPIPEQLRYLRWLMDHGMLEHDPAGAPAGEYAESIGRLEL